MAGKTIKKATRPAAVGRAPTSGSFTKENPGPGRGHGKKRTATQEAGEKIVAEMDRAYSTAEGPDDPVGVKAARKLAHENYERFITLYVKAMEMAGAREPVERVVAEEVTAAATAGPKEERVGALIEQLLREWEVEDGQADGPGSGAAE